MTDINDLPGVLNEKGKAVFRTLAARVDMPNCEHGLLVLCFLIQHGCPDEDLIAWCAEYFPERRGQRQ